jgi:histidine triad (HIT) family protein
MDCVFCQIIQKKIKSKIIFEDDMTLGFKDSNPAAPFHFLIVPKKHIASINEINEFNSSVLAKIFENIPKIAAKFSLKSYRLVNNTGAEAGQSVMHLHFHILGGRNLAWPPG